MNDIKTNSEVLKINNIEEYNKKSKNYHDNIIKSQVITIIALANIIRNYLNSDSVLFETIVMVGSIIYAVCNSKKKKEIDEKILTLKKQ